MPMCRQGAGGHALWAPDVLAVFLEVRPCAVRPCVSGGEALCWPAQLRPLTVRPLHRWMQARPDCKLCPVCKAGTDEASVTPIFGRGREQVDPRKTNPRPYLRREPEADSIPRRPPGQRPPAVDVRTSSCYCAAAKLSHCVLTPSRACSAEPSWWQILCSTDCPPTAP